jgi:endonuclease G
MALFAVALASADKDPIGFPVAMMVLKNDSYVVGYSTITRTPMWVREVLTVDDRAQRVGDFHDDARIPLPWRSKVEDYNGTSWDRGHCAPAGDALTAEASKRSFLMSNMMPQAPSLNRGLWAHLESRVRGLAADGTVYAFTGIVNIPNRGQHTVHWIGNTQISTHCYKVAYIQDRHGKFTAQAWLVPNKDLPPGAKISDYLVAVREIEKWSGLDFGSQLPADVQEAIEN